MHPPSELKLDALAMFLFKGGSIRVFAASVGISERTAQRWARMDAVGARVTMLRKTSLARASNRLSAAADELAQSLIDMGKQEAPGDAVRLGALKAGLSASVAFARHLDV